MIFASIVFLFLFLPLTFAIYFLLPRRFKNFVLLVASLFFYWWGTGELFFLILVSILVDYLCGWGQYLSGSLTIKRFYVTVSVFVNLGLLAYFKYFGFFVDNINSMLSMFGSEGFQATSIALPIGISFYTFQTISYQIDLYRGHVRHQRSLINFSLFVALFPQLVAGPIVRYREIEKEIASRRESLNDLGSGALRFMFGLAKKVLLADPIGRFSDYVFSRPVEHLPAELAWLGGAAFALQIFLDFDAYSDMAIGIGRIFGFRFPENFNFPYIARSFRELWQRWHMTLMRWLRDYLLLGLRQLPGGRKAVNRNIFVVFILCGLWHGASWHFVVWGLFNGLLVTAERGLPGRILKTIPVIFQHLYVLFFWILSAPLFRASSLREAYSFIKAMFGFNSGASLDALFFVHADWTLMLLFSIAILLSVPTIPFLYQEWNKFDSKSTRYFPKVFLKGAGALGIILIVISSFLFTVATVVSSSKNPFIYFRF